MICDIWPPPNSKVQLTPLVCDVGQCRRAKLLSPKLLLYGCGFNGQIIGAVTTALLHLQPCLCILSLLLIMLHIIQFALH